LDEGTGFEDVEYPLPSALADGVFNVSGMPKVGSRTLKL
jgi:hypothetical protein